MLTTVTLASLWDLFFADVGSAATAALLRGTMTMLWVFWHWRRVPSSQDVRTHWNLVIQLILFGMQLSISSWLHWLRKLGWFKVAPLDRTSSSELAAFWLQMEQRINKSWEDSVDDKPARYRGISWMLLFQPQQLLQRSGALAMAIWLPLELIEASKNPIYNNLQKCLFSRWFEVHIYLLACQSSKTAAGGQQGPGEVAIVHLKACLECVASAICNAWNALNSRGDQFEGLVENSMKEDVSPYRYVAWDCLHVSFVNYGKFVCQLVPLLKSKESCFVESDCWCLLILHTSSTVSIVHLFRFVCSLAAWWQSIPSGGHSFCALCCATRLAGWGRSCMDLLAFDCGAKFSTLCFFRPWFSVRKRPPKLLQKHMVLNATGWQWWRDTTATGRPQLLHLPAGWSSSWPRQMQKLRKQQDKSWWDTFQASAQISTSCQWKRMWKDTRWNSVNEEYIIQVVPGQAGGGSFKREKDLYSKERICL